MKQLQSMQWMALTGGLALILSGCGGGGGGGGATSQSATSSQLSVTVLDGLIENALVCLDSNVDGACNGAEPQGRTDANGQVSLAIANQDAGKYPVVAVVDVDAVDKDTGRVPTRYTMQAPKDAPTLVTPLTTLVQTMVAQTGATTDEAAAAVQAQLGISHSPLSDFSKRADARAQAIANAVVVTAQAQATAVNSAVGAAIANGVQVSQSDIDKLVAKKVAALTDQLVLAATSASVTAATNPIARVTALKNKATAILAAGGIDTAASAIGALQLEQGARAETSASLGSGTAWLAYLDFQSVSDVYLRFYASTAAENTADASNNVKLRWLRYQSFANGDSAAWAAGSNPSRGADLHWNGSVWKACGIHEASTLSVPNTTGQSTYNYCDHYETGQLSSKTANLGGKKMVDVYRSLLNQGHANLVLGADLKSAASLLGNAVFPVDAQVAYRTTATQKFAPAYYPGPSNWLELPDAQLARGDQKACNLSTTPAGSLAANLEQLVATYRGTPCIIGQDKSAYGLNGAVLDSGSRNEWWGATTLHLGLLGDAPTYANAYEASSYYTGNKRIRVAFGDGNTVKYFVCTESWVGSTRNCDGVGTGTYVVEQLGNSRVMRFAGLPTVLRGAQNWNRVYVESAGRVYFGYQNLSTPRTSAMLNMQASNALFAKLGLTTRISPQDTLKLNAGSYEGIYAGTVSGPGISGNFSFFVNPGYATYCAGTSSALVSATNATGSFTCSGMVITPRPDDSAVADIRFGTTSSGATFFGTVNYYTGVVSGSWSDSGTLGSFIGMRL